MAIDPKQLSMLLDVVRTGSFSAAAKLRNVSQPAISLAIAQLERQLRVILIERSRRGATPTPAGEILVRRAEALEEQLAAAEREVLLNGAGVEGPLVVGGPPGALLSLVPEAVRRMTADNPNFALQILESPDGELLAQLRLGKIDMALGAIGVDPPPSDVVELEIAVDSFALIVGAGHRLNGPSIVLANLSDAGWVLPAVGGTFRRQVDALFLGAQVPAPINVIRCDSLATTKEIIRVTDYVTVLPRRIVAAELASGLLRALELEGASMSRRIGVRMLRRAGSAPLTKRFIAALQETGS